MAYPHNELVREMSHPFLGHLQLWAIRTESGQSATAQVSTERHEWRGMSGDVPFTIPVDADADQHLRWMRSTTCALLMAAAQRKLELKQRVAAEMIDVARDWTGEQSLSLAALVDALHLSLFQVWVDAENFTIDVWFKDSANIFRDHSILGCLDSVGELRDIGLEG